MVEGLVSAGAVVAGSAALIFAGSLTISTAFGSVILATTMSVLNKMVYVYLADRETRLVKRVARDSILVAVLLASYLPAIALGLFAL